MQQMPQIASPLVKYKLVFLGDQSVGKTSIINRFIYDSFDGKDHPTVGIDFISKTLRFDDRTIRLQLWDTAGQERFRSLIPSYIRDSSVAVIVYDITSNRLLYCVGYNDAGHLKIDRMSFENVRKWVDDVHAQRGNEVLIVIVGNKADLEQDRYLNIFIENVNGNSVVRKEDGEVKAKSYEAHFVEVSAKTGDSIPTLFKVIASTLPGSENSQMISMSGRASTQPQPLGIPSSNNQAPNIKLNQTPEPKKSEKQGKQGCC